MKKSLEALNSLYTELGRRIVDDLTLNGSLSNNTYELIHELNAYSKDRGYFSNPNVQKNPTNAISKLTGDAEAIVEEHFAPLKSFIATCKNETVMTKELISQFVSVMDTLGSVYWDDEMHVLVTRASRGLGSDAEAYLDEEPVSELKASILYSIESSIEYRTNEVKDVMLSELHGGDIPAEDITRWLDENDDKTQAVVRTALMGAARNFYRDLADSLGRPYESLKGQESHLNDVIVEHLMGRFK